MEYCSIDSCESKVLARNFCSIHYRRWWSYGDPLFTKYNKTGIKKIPTPEYKAWANMKWRCNAKKGRHAKYYSKRGIKVCERWQGEDGYNNFLADMGERPSLKHSIDRINNDGDYEPSNCVWATSNSQNMNKRNNSKTPNIHKVQRGFVVAIQKDNIILLRKFYKTLDEAVKARDETKLKYGL